jgi:hypothetical protein
MPGEAIEFIRIWFGPSGSEASEADSLAEVAMAFSNGRAC